MQKLVRLRMRPARNGKSFRYMLDFIDECGKRRQLSLGHADRRKAERQRREKEMELQMGLVRPSLMRLSEFREDCLIRTRGQIRPSSIREYRNAMRDLMQCIGDIDIRQVQYQHGETFIRWCFDRGNAPATVAKKIRHLKRMLQLAVDRGQLEDHPWRRIRPPRSPRRKVRVFSEKEQQSLLTVVREYDAERLNFVSWELIVRVALCTGMRWGELMNTTWMDIDFENRTLEVAPKMNTTHTWDWHIKDTHRRTLPLTDAVLEMLAAYQAEQPEGYPYVFLPPERYDHIQSVRKQGRWTIEHSRRVTNNFHRTFRGLLTRAGISGRFHDLRRTRLSRWLADGLSEFEVMTLAGHSSFSTTHTFYLEVRQDLLDRARAVMETSEGGNLLRACGAPPSSSDTEKGHHAQTPDGPSLINRARQDSNLRPTD